MSKTLAGVVVGLGLAGGCLSGCTLIGLGIGALSDTGKKPLLLAPSQIGAVKVGRKVEVGLVDGRLVTGEYLGLDPSSDSEYTQRWADAQAALGPDVLLPALGAGTLVTTLDGAQVRGEFQGVDPGAVVIRRASTNTATRLDIAQVAAIADGRARLTHGSLMRLVQEGRLPPRSRLMIKGAEGNVIRVSPADVTSVSAAPDRNGKKKGALIGLAADALILIAVAAADGSSSPPPSCDPNDPNCIHSCPLVYSFDGRHWVLDSEVFGAAIFESAQLSDRAMLDHLSLQDGVYRIRLVNNMDEIQWVDSVKLLVVDHPEGTRVVPSVGGTLHLLGPAAVVPARITDLGGRDVRRLLAARDGRAWVSNAAAVAPDVRDGLEFELPRPPGAATVTVAVTARSQSWADEAKERVLALLGDGLEAWRARMEADPAARAEFLGALRREVLLTLRVWDGARWRTVGELANLATAATREKAVRVDLAGLPSDVLRFRLDAAPGLWTVDAVEAEFGAAVAPEAQALAPVTARARDGRDLRDMLDAVDGQRYEMEPWVSEAELAFAAPPTRSGWRRSLAIEATGHYTTLVRGHGAPQQARFDRLVREPGAFARFSLEAQRGAAAARNAVPAR